MTAEIRLKTIGSFPWETPKNQNRVSNQNLTDCVFAVSQPLFRTSGGRFGRYSV